MEALKHLNDLMISVPDISGLANLAFYQEINDFLRDELAEFQDNLVGRMMRFIGLFATACLTIWILIQGYRIVTGRSRESLMGLVVDSLRALFIVGIATGMAMSGTAIYTQLTDGVGDVIVGVVSGGDSDSLYGEMDRALATMSLALGSVESVKVEPGTDAEGAKKRSMYFVGIGTAGPAITAGIMLTLNKVAMALFVGLGPFFVLCLLFDATKPLFQRWLLYGIGTIFSLAVLYVMVMLAMDLVLAVAAAFWAGTLLEVVGEQGINTMAIQQGGIGLILTMLLISAPPMAAAFFQGTLGSFMAFSQLDAPGSHGRRGAAAPVGTYGPGSPPTALNDRSEHGRSGFGSIQQNPGRLTQHEQQSRIESDIRPVGSVRAPGDR